MLSAEAIIRLLDLQPLQPEGGFFRETYRGGPWPGEANRAISTAIYYLLTRDTFSAVHRLPTDEIYHFYLGDPVELLLLGPGGGQLVVLGQDLQQGQRPQILVPAGVWQGSRVLGAGSCALLGTTMAPGFEFRDYEPGAREVLSEQYPTFADSIRALTRPND